MTLPVANFLAGGTLRVGQILVDSALYVLIGFLTAGMLRAVVGPARVRGLFGSGRVAAPCRAWLAATLLLPVCALGVLPVVAEFRRAGVPRHALLTFALAAPMLNPISLVAGISYLGPTLILALLAGSMVVAVGSGIALGAGDGPPAGPVEDGPAAAAAGPGRLAAALVMAGRAATGSVVLDMAVGLLGAGAMAASLPESLLAESLFDDDGWAVGRMALVAPLTYATPDQGVAILPEMIKFRQSAGAMFVFVALGVGMTLGHASWSCRAYGPRVAARWLGTAGLLALVVGLATGGLVAPVGTANSDNDHFNEFGNPFLGGRGRPDLGGHAARFARQVEPVRWAIVAALAGLVGAGAWCRATGRVGPAPAGRPAPARGPSAWDRPVPPRVLGLAGAGLGMALAAAGAYAYFPPPVEVFRDMNLIKADFFGELGARTMDPARHHLDLWERQAAKLAVGALIRFAPADDQARRRTDDLRAALGRLRAELDAGRPDRARALSLEVGQVQARCKQAYRLP